MRRHSTALILSIFVCFPAGLAAQTPPDSEPKTEENKDLKTPDPKDADKDAKKGEKDQLERPTSSAKEEAKEEPTSEPTSAPNEHAKKMAQPHPRTKYDAPVRKPDIDSQWNNELDAFMRRYRWQIGIGGYIRAGYTAIQDDPGGVFGNNDGFGLANARLTLNGSLRKSAGFRFQIDGGVQRRSATNDPNAEVVVRAKDMFIWWQPIRYAKLSVGQFKAPFDAEALASNVDIPFVNRSVSSRGVTNVEGANVAGLSRDREAGAMLSSRFHFGDGAKDEQGFGISYALAATNGRSAERALNDNDSLAGYGRLNFHWSDMVQLGGAVTLNDRTLGVAPNTVEESMFGWTADLLLRLGGLSVLGSVIGITRENDIQSEFSSLGFQGSLAYRDPIFGFQPVFRYAMLDPTNTLEDDALSYITFGLNYVPKYPFRLLLNYTITGEEDPNTLTNNKFDVLLQVMW